MRRTSSSHAATPGQDSFLDVAANLVGILIILVMVVGAHAKNAVLNEFAAAPAVAPKVDVAEAETTAASVERSLHELEAKINRETFEVSYRKAERDHLQTVVLLAEQELAKSREVMSDEERAKYDLSQEMIRSKGELDRLGKSLTAIVKPSPAVLQHLPTPMAKTVFGKEVHFRLLGGRIAYVPFDEMTEAFQKEAPSKLQKLRSAPRIEESLPVMNGFGARYILRREGTSVMLEVLYFVDAEENLGEPFQRALQPGSLFRSRLAGLDPKRTTVTFWVYPDSFDQFRQVKADLFKLGFLTAARPHNFEDPIGASPDGSRSTAE